MITKCSEKGGQSVKVSRMCKLGQCMGYRGPRQTDEAASHADVFSPVTVAAKGTVRVFHAFGCDGQCFHASLSACHDPETWTSNRESALVSTLDRLR